MNTGKLLGFAIGIFILTPLLNKLLRKPIGRLLNKHGYDADGKRLPQAARNDDPDYENDVDLLISFVRNHNDFKIIPPDISVPYNHMGATITDTILQAGLKWESVVKPRIINIMSQPTAKTSTGFSQLVEREGIKKILNWNDDEKPSRIINVIRLFKNEKIETETDLKSWLQNDLNIMKLKKLRGIGNKTADYFKILAGIPTNAVDRHLIKCLKMAKIDIRPEEYSRAHNIIDFAADRMKIDKSKFDYSIWKYMSDKPQRCSRTT